MYLKLLKRFVGVILVLFGILGLFLPIVPGTPFIIAGLLLIGVKAETIKRWIVSGLLLLGVRKKTISKWLKKMEH